MLFNRTQTLRYAFNIQQQCLRSSYANIEKTMATNAPTPDGYVSVFTNLGASLQASNYMGLYTLTSYDTLTCASKCDQASGCSAFNVYLERDPTVNANAQNCPNPPSTTNYKCTLWGAPIAAAEATNTGQYQDSFQVVIAGSNGGSSSNYRMINNICLKSRVRVQQRFSAGFCQLLLWPSRAWWGDQCSPKLGQLHGVPIFSI